jgi:CBS-domain-containing membrane protein
LLVYDRIDAAGFWIHDHHRAGVSTERAHCHATYFRVFSRDIVLRDQRLDPIPQRFFSRALSRDSGQAGCLGAAACCQTLNFSATSTRLAPLGASALLIFCVALGGPDGGL